MTPFLKELASQILSGPTPLEQLTLVFPNRRAGLYFQHYLAQELTRPQWAPRLLSIEQFFAAQSNLREPDHLTLIFQLYRVYARVIGREEPFDQFYFWGDMLLRDFDEVDKYRVDAALLFKDLSKLKELDETFDYLTPEQKKFLTQFWLHFQHKPSATREEFLRLWRKLPQVYSEFVKALKKEGLGYEGMIHRSVADQTEKKPPPAAEAERIVFAGFNALTRAEECVLCAYVKQGARVYWDYDEYYVNDSRQEAGAFARLYRHHPVLAKTFATEPVENFKTKKSVTLTGVAQRIGQAKLAGARVKEILDALPPESRDSGLFKTVIVLPDESMLLPVLHSLPPDLPHVNVTMGFPLRATPLFTLLDLLIEMQIRRKADRFAHREVTAVLNHAYLVALAEKESAAARQRILQNNLARLPAHELQAAHPVFYLLFQPAEADTASAYLLEVVKHLGASFTDKQHFDREYAYHFYQQLARLSQIFAEGSPAPDWRGYQKLFRQVAQSQKIPFAGEPLRGLQIMGVLETRNLDFENVIVLSLNEGSLPAAQRQGSYIPHALRKVYGLPANEQHDAMYAYLFYRVLQRAGHINLLYSTEPDIVGNGEMSRYVLQLLLESGLPIERSVLHNKIHVNRIQPISIEKTAGVQEQMNRYRAGQGDRYLSPSSLNDFIECGLRFYLKHLAGLYEAEEVQEDVDARRFGNLLHDVVFWLYDEMQKESKELTAEMLRAAGDRLPELIDRAFRKQHNLSGQEPVTYKGQRVVVKEVVHAFAKRILAVDESLAPIVIEHLEELFEFELMLPDGSPVRVGGKIDRVDRTGGRLRVIDYKTGGDKLEFSSVESLFARDQNRNKAAFQTLLYALAYQRAHSSTEPLQPGLYNRSSLFEDKFSFGLKLNKVDIEDAVPLQAVFDALLHETVHLLFDPSQPFTQTTFEKNCTYCAYRTLCRR